MYQTHSSIIRVSNVQICRNCKGEGYLTPKPVHIGHGNYEEKLAEECRICKGSGLVKVVKEIETKIFAKDPKDENQYRIKLKKRT